jgi:hypothetical protein
VPEVCVVHLVWAPLGADPLRRFVQSYRAVPSGRDHVLLVILNGFSEGPALEAARAELADVEHEDLLLDEPMQDLAAYRAGAEHTTARTLCFLNSHSELIAGSWLALLHDQLQVPGVGVVGASGSHESVYSDTPLPLKPLRWRQYPAFPNPHLRTNAFMLERDLMLELDWRVGRSKASAHRLESGAHGITRQIVARGAEARVVGRDGEGYEPEAWPTSRTYRSGAQENLLVADNRTRQYAEADVQRRQQLARMAWGDAALRDPLATSSDVIP